MGRFDFDKDERGRIYLITKKARAGAKTFGLGTVT